MYKYKNTKTGRIVTTTCPVNGGQWEELTDEEELIDEQEDGIPDEEELTEEQTPAKPAKKGEK